MEKNEVGVATVCNSDISLNLVLTVVAGCGEVS